MVGGGDVDCKAGDEGGVEGEHWEWGIEIDRHNDAAARYVHTLMDHNNCSSWNNAWCGWQFFTEESTLCGRFSTKESELTHHSLY